MIELDWGRKGLLLTKRRITQGQGRLMFVYAGLGKIKFTVNLNQRESEIH